MRDTNTSTEMRVTATKHRINADLLIPGRGEPVHNAALVHADGKILFAGPEHDLPSALAVIPASHRVPVLMPGLWDCHVHFQGTTGYTVDTLYATPAVVAGAHIARDLAATLNAGYTSVRELSGYGVDLAAVVDPERDGWLPGPRIYSAVSILSPTAGHGDARSVPSCHFHSAIEMRGLPAAVCDGPDACVKAVRDQVRRGASCIKVAASGGIADAGDDVQAQQFSDPELRAIVDEAARWGLSVAAHCHGKAGTMAALRAGCLTIEHGSFLDDEAVALLKEKHAILVATRSTVEAVARLPELWTPGQLRKIRQVREQHAESYVRAVRAGVRIALGTDILISSRDVPWGHGMNARELRYAVEAGMTPLQAIEAATATAPETLGSKAPRSGRLHESYDADFISLDRSPLDDVRVLEDPANVINVWKGGKWVKKHGKPINILD